MKTLCRFAVAVVSVLLLIAASPASIPAGGPAQVRVADGDAGGGG
jgi:hypothetical protein